MSLKTVLFSNVSRKAAEMVATFLCSSPDSELGSNGGEGLIPELPVAVGLCSRSLWLRSSVWTFGKNSSPRELVQRGNRLPSGPAVSILGWTEPWLTRCQAGESPAAPGGGRGGSMGPVPPVFLGFSGVRSSAQHNRGVREGTKALTWSLTPSQTVQLASSASSSSRRTEHTWPQDFLGLRPPPALSPSHLDTSFPHMQKP